MEKTSPPRKVRVESLASSIRRADRERLSPFEMTVASRCCGGALIKAMNKGRSAGHNTVACQSIHRYASDRGSLSDGQSPPWSCFCAKYRNIPFVYQTRMSPSTIVGLAQTGVTGQL